MGVVGYGVVIKNCASKLEHGVYGGLGMATNNEAEIRALEVGLNLCVQNGYSKVLIEGDSQVIINGIIKSKFQCRKLDKWLPCINHMLELIGTFEIMHVFREGNRMADYLANLGVALVEACMTDGLLMEPWTEVALVKSLAQSHGSMAGFWCLTYPKKLSL
ncbi:hypothetical protein SUGI_0183340 [Cryptomeria japonica]|nr:hypothetical protein SUGI_0183340 [Cryptomeria japonica]